MQCQEGDPNPSRIVQPRKSGSHHQSLPLESVYSAVTGCDGLDMALLSGSPECLAVIRLSMVDHLALRALQKLSPAAVHTSREDSRRIDKLQQQSQVLSVRGFGLGPGNRLCLPLVLGSTHNPQSTPNPLPAVQSPKVTSKVMRRAASHKAVAKRESKDRDPRSPVGDAPPGRLLRREKSTGPVPQSTQALKPGLGGHGPYGSRGVFRSSLAHKTRQDKRGLGGLVVSPMRLDREGHS
ncbi:hypothetical protein KIPB_010670 [Kipferlia bialata]|uniref:Uncharacterized protein n=1 Tax=Kipferlia bialata TaxID=797122 RepID=A0A9K3GMQ1_9EUKA|nr:hypothetical protein KIPB_010670 [Kipferlia bialata]|eukprot:g10670.t1